MTNILGTLFAGLLLLAAGVVVLGLAAETLVWAVGEPAPGRPGKLFEERMR